MEGCMGSGRYDGFDQQEVGRSEAETDQGADGSSGRPLVGVPRGARVRDRPPDGPPSGQPDRRIDRCSLPSWARLEIARFKRLQLPTTGAPRGRAQLEGAPALEAGGVAREEQRISVFVDECGLSAHPERARAWARAERRHGSRRPSTLRASRSLGDCRSGDSTSRSSLVRLCRQTPHPFVLDENIDDLAILLRTKSDLAMDVVNLKMRKVGGPTRFRQARDLSVFLHGNRHNPGRQLGRRLRDGSDRPPGPEHTA